MIFKAMVTDKKTKEKLFLERDCKTKSNFISEIRRNGYKVNPCYVLEKEKFDEILKYSSFSIMHHVKYKGGAL